jgi:hypothetical protein
MTIEITILAIVLLVVLACALMHPRVQACVPARARAVFGLIFGGLLLWWGTRKKNPTPSIQRKKEPSPTPHFQTSTPEEIHEESQRIQDDHMRAGPDDDIGARLDRWANDEDSQDM